MDKFLNAINELNYKDIWLENIENGNLITYFDVVDREERKYLELYYVLFSDYSFNLLDDKDVKILNYIEVCVNNLLDESKNRKLKNSERKFLSMLLSGKILYNKKIEDEKIVSYVNNCYLENKEFCLSTDLVILLKYSFINLNNYNNSNIGFKLKNSNFMKEDFGKFNLNLETLNKEIFITNDYYNSFTNEYDNIDLDDFSYMLVFQTAILLHEFRHYMQFRLIFRDSLSEEEELLKKELEILLNDNSIYNVYGESFNVELDAYKYAIDNLDYFIKDFVVDIYYDSIKEEVISKINNCIKVRDISDIIDKEYKNIKKKTRDLV